MLLTKLVTHPEGGLTQIGACIQGDAIRQLILELRAGRNSLDHPFVRDLPANSNDWKNRNIVIHININPPDKLQIGTDEIGPSYFERNVEVSPREVAKLAIEPGMGLNSQKDRRRNLQIRANRQIQSLDRIRHRSCLLRIKREPLPLNPKSQQYLVLDLRGQDETG